MSVSATRSRQAGWWLRKPAHGPIGTRLAARLGLLLALACALLLAGCATPQLASLQRQLPPDLPPAAHIAQVPFFPQEEYQCGPASLAMVAQFAGRSVTPEELRPQVYLPERQGSLQLEMLVAARRQGLMALTLAPQLEALLRQVAAGHPVVVLQNLSLPWAPLWHYAVVIGYDLPAQTLVLHSGLNERMTMRLDTFERTWARGQHWAMVALPPQQLPPGLAPPVWLQAAAALERLQPAAAEQAYAAATRTWPDNGLAWLGLGNARYAQGELTAAAQALASATQAVPDLADAWNNLAQVRLEQKRLDDAQRAIEQAVQLGGPHLPRYLELRQKIAALRAPAQ